MIVECYILYAIVKPKKESNLRNTLSMLNRSYIFHGTVNFCLFTVLVLKALNSETIFSKIIRK